ncbi:hypothetical protein NDU88_002286 [Pleurodeles waltl]|uniref:Uncharacterized protein n=1 Tax=Pleurodeles waltl TaxID=8319 RepID=A0AAV7MV87_PLEWA|nr:hypothetical protein NDU88_002286 [Pleurodeles waltl]
MHVHQGAQDGIHTNQAKLQFDSRKSHSPGGDGIDPGSERRPDKPAVEEQDLRQILVAMQHSLTQNDGKIDSLSYRMDRMTERLDKHAERLDQSERRVSEVEDGQTQLAATHVKLNKEVHDLEARSRRNNLRIVGVTEITAIDNMEGFIERLLVKEVEMWMMQAPRQMVGGLYAWAPLGSIRPAGLCAATGSRIKCAMDGS